MAVIRTNHSKEYTVLANHLLQNSSLSWQARGLLVYLLSLPDQWQIRLAHLVKQSPAGKKAIYTIIKELIEAGYMIRIQSQNLQGRWESVIYDVYEQPQLQKCLPKSGQDNTVKNPLKAENKQLNESLPLSTLRDPDSAPLESTKEKKVLNHSHKILKEPPSRGRGENEEKRNAQLKAWFYSHCLGNKLPYTAEEIEIAWKTFTAYPGQVFDSKKFLIGICEKNRNRNSEKEKLPCRTISGNPGCETSKNENSSSLEKNTRMPPSKGISFLELARRANSKYL